MQIGKGWDLRVLGDGDGVMEQRVLPKGLGGDNHVAPGSATWGGGQGWVHQENVYR